MNFYIVDDDHSIVKMIEEIVKDSSLGEILGVNSNSVEAFEECTFLKPDLILLDLLMPEMDGLTFIEKLKPLSPKTKYVMISQVSSKKMIGDAYDTGITFFVSKPINRKEIRQILKNINEQILLEKSLNKIKHVLSVDLKLNEEIQNDLNLDLKNIEKKYKLVFSKLGILGESGCDEIIKCCSFITSHNLAFGQIKLMDISQEIFENPKAVEQRIRRAINKGLTNLAHLGVEDYLNETFVKYSNTLFDFEQVRTEMEFIRGNTTGGGKINIKKFLDNLVILVDET